MSDIKSPVASTDTRILVVRKVNWTPCGSVSGFLDSSEIDVVRGVIRRRSASRAETCNERLDLGTHEKTPADPDPLSWITGDHDRSPKAPRL